eukprot:1159278-Pelagomonas_calceolata.AAC.2
MLVLSSKTEATQDSFIQSSTLLKQKCPVSCSRKHEVSFICWSMSKFNNIYILQGLLIPQRSPPVQAGGDQVPASLLVRKTFLNAAAYSLGQAFFLMLTF